MAFTVYKLQYASTCAYCEQEINGGEGLRLLRTVGTARTGLDFHTSCWRQALSVADALEAVDLIEVAGVYYHPDEAPHGGQAFRTTAADPSGSRKVIPKRR